MMAFPVLMIAFLFVCGLAALLFLGISLISRQTVNSLASTLSLIGILVIGGFFLFTVQSGGNKESRRRAAGEETQLARRGTSFRSHGNEDIKQAKPLGKELISESSKIPVSSKRIPGETDKEHPQHGKEQEENFSGTDKSGDSGAISQAVPSWVAETPSRVGPVYREVVSVYPYDERDRFTVEELDAALKQKTDSYIDRWLEAGASKTLDVDLQFIDDYIVKDQYEKKKQSSLGEMTELFVLLEFDEQVRQRLRQRWQDAVLSQRLTVFGGLTVCLLLLVGIVFSYLRIDTATKGYYTGRLQLLASIAILAVLLCGVRVWQL